MHIFDTGHRFGAHRYFFDYTYICMTEDDHIPMANADNICFSGESF